MRERMLRLGVAVLVLGLALGGVLGAQQAVRLFGTNDAGASVPVKVASDGTLELTLGVGGYAFEGATADDYETSLAVVDPTADNTITFPDYTGSINVWANANTQDVNIVFEGATANDYETTVTVTDPTADRTITIPNASGTVAFLASPAFTGAPTIANADTSAGSVKFFEDSDNGTNTATLIGPAATADVTITLPATTGTVALVDSQIFTTNAVFGAIASQDVIKILPVTDNDRFTGIITVADLTTADKTYTLPDLTGTVALTGASQAVSFAGITGTAYTVGAAAGVDCTSALAVTVAKGIVTACTAPDPDMTPAALLAQIQALVARVAELEAQLGRKQ